jgi:hypothetical protein
MLLYSTTTWLAHQISHNFYKGQFWVYCAPTFSGPVGSHAPPSPPSSTPKGIYWSFLEDVRGKDLHSAKILQNRAGLKKGAIAKQADGAIAPDELADIHWIIDSATIEDFRPLLYVIPQIGVASRLKRVSPKHAANPFSVEYIIEDLKASEFHALELHL